jgi:hypothetical protein
MLTSIVHFATLAYNFLQVPNAYVYEAETAGRQLSREKYQKVITTCWATLRF